MINPSFQELSKISKSRYDICVMVMKRARLLIDGSRPMVESKGKKPCTVALDEIMAGKVQSRAPSMKKIREEREEAVKEEIREEKVDLSAALEDCGEAAKEEVSSEEGEA